MRATLSNPWFSRDVPVLSAAKGIEFASGHLMSAVIRELGWPDARSAAISGPNLAHEIAQGMPAAAVIASRDEANAKAWRKRSPRPFPRLRTGDVTGVELAGALKNVVAIAVGAGFGLGFGTIPAAAILTPRPRRDDAHRRRAGS